MIHKQHKQSLFGHFDNGSDCTNENKTGDEIFNEKVIKLYQIQYR